MSSNARDAYLENQVFSATPQKLKLMLIEGAMRFIGKARAAWRSGEVIEARKALSRCREIIGELLASWAAIESTIGRRAAALYSYLLRTLSEVKDECDEAKLDEVLRVLEVERETWQAVCDRFGSLRGDVNPSSATSEAAPHSSFSCHV
jgi:flagellar protein FliS